MYVRTNYRNSTLVSAHAYMDTRSTSSATPCELCVYAPSGNICAVPASPHPVFLFECGSFWTYTEYIQAKRNRASVLPRLCADTKTLLEPLWPRCLPPVAAAIEPYPQAATEPIDTGRPLQPASSDRQGQTHSPPCCPPRLYRFPESVCTGQASGGCQASGPTCAKVHCSRRPHGRLYPYGLERAEWGRRFT